MGKEELLNALVELQTKTSINSLCAQYSIIHNALRDIHRKRWRFLEDACSVVLYHIFGLTLNGQDKEIEDSDRQNLAISTTKAVELYLQFIEPLIHSTVSIANVLDDEQESTNQRGVLVAALLHLFAKFSGNLASKEVKSRLVADVLKCDVEIHIVLATLRFRERLVECRRVLLPSYESDSETESELELDEEEREMREFAMEDIQWIVDRVANTWGLTKYRRFLQMSLHKHAFSSWSYQGIGNFIHALLLNDQHELSALPVVVSPFSWLFHVTAYAHYMIRSEDHQDRIRGLGLLRAVNDLCPQEKLTIFVTKGSEAMRDKPQSFLDHAAPFCARDWLSPLIHVITNAMISFREANDRSGALKVLKELISKLVGDDRFRLLRDLIMKCPYTTNVSAVLNDFVRGDAVQAWSSSDTGQKYPFKTAAICLLIQDVLSQTVERDLVFQTDLLASCLSLVRFLYICDKDNETGICTKSVKCNIWEVLVRISKRLRVEIEETTSRHNAKAGLHFIENAHFMVLEAALGSTLELLSEPRTPLK
ncbi:unnamed protein product [Peronospora destructor]|uniref:Uncharacterized protein n=1 Tax=Peronospora destructor TaxID=86335 RepID=A0AAV0UUL7_9STRA|nr:unnamed protein product [Peronospora destructor]